MKTAPEVEKQVIDLYYKLGVMARVAETVNINRKTVRRILRKNNITPNPCPPKYQFNDNYFNIAIDAERAYWLGFIMGDGCVSNGSLHIELHKKDTGHLQKLLDSMESNHPIYHTHKSSIIAIRSNVLCESLAAYNIVPRKSKGNITVPIDKIPLKYQRDYFRGLVDADGCLHFTKSGFWSITLTGNLSTIKDFRDWIMKEFNFEGLANIRQIHENTYQLQSGGNVRVPPIINKLYNKSKIFLDRKYELSIGAIEIHRQNIINQRKKEERKREMVMKYINGCSGHSIAKEFCVGYDTIYKAVRDSGYIVRQRGGVI